MYKVWMIKINKFIKKVCNHVYGNNKLDFQMK